MVVQDKIAKVQVWDTAGQERYRSITNAYYRGAEAILIIFDLTCKDSFNSIPNWISEVKKYTGNEVMIVIGANKADLKSKREVSDYDISELKKNRGLDVFEMSAKTGKGVEDAFKKVVENLIKRKNSGTDKGKDDKDKIELDKNQGETNQGKCC